MEQDKRHAIRRAAIVSHSDYLTSTSALSQLSETLYAKALPKRIQYYHPHAKQKKFHAASAYCRLLFGPNRSGKTLGLVTECCAWALGHRPWDGTRTPMDTPTRVVICGNDFTRTIRGNICKYIEQLLPAEVFLDPPKNITLLHSGIPGIYHLKNGSQIFLYSYGQEQRTVEAASIDFAGFDEEPPEPFFTAITRGLQDRGGRMAFSLTPLYEPWIFEKLFSRVGHDPDYWGLTMNRNDNPHIGEKEKRRFETTLDPEEKWARVHGRPRYLMGRIYKRFEPEKHVINHEEFMVRFPDFHSYPKGLAIDPAGAKPWAMLWYVVTPKDQIVIFDEWPNDPFYEDREQRSLDRYADIISDKEKKIAGGPRTVVWRIMDPIFGKAPSLKSGKSLEWEMQSLGFSFDTRIEHKVELGILKVRSLLELDSLGEPTLMITSKCANLIQSMTRYSRDSEGKKINDRYSDMADALRFCVMSDPHYRKLQDVQDRREKVMARLKNAW